MKKYKSEWNWQSKLKFDHPVLLTVTRYLDKKKKKNGHHWPTATIVEEKCK